MNIFITGVAGFIGSTLALRLLNEGHMVTGADNINDYYDVSLKETRLKRLHPFNTFRFHRLDVDNRQEILRIFSENPFSVVYHLAAQVGVRYALENPFAYMDSNLTGFGNILEGSRQSGVSHLIFASSSSVYGGNTRQPFSEHHPTEHPLSLYAATKKANEIMAHSYPPPVCPMVSTSGVGFGPGDHWWLFVMRRVVPDCPHRPWNTLQRSVLVPTPLAVKRTILRKRMRDWVTIKDCLLSPEVFCGG